MGEIYYYIEETGEMKAIDAVTTLEFISAAEDFGKEADARVFETLPPFEGKIEIEDAYTALNFRMLFKTWEGLVPRKIGVWA